MSLLASTCELVGLRLLGSLTTFCMAQHSTLRWEFLTTLDYEWNVIRGRRLCRWTIWVRTQSVFERHVAYLGASDRSIPA